MSNSNEWWNETLSNCNLSHSSTKLFFNWKKIKKHNCYQFLPVKNIQHAFYLKARDNHRKIIPMSTIILSINYMVPGKVQASPHCTHLCLSRHPQFYQRWRSHYQRGCGMPCSLCCSSCKETCVSRKLCKNMLNKNVRRVSFIWPSFDFDWWTWNNAISNESDHKRKSYA